MGVFSHHEPCPSCGSSDALAVYVGDPWASCFSCKANVRIDSTAVTEVRRVSNSPPVCGEIRALTKRGITKETCSKFGYACGDGVQIANYYDESGQIVAQKIRDAAKNFRVTGDLRAALPLYGQQLWKPGKKIVITEGEIDALSMSQAQDNKWPVVSVPTGAAGAAKAIEKAAAWLDQFESVVFMFDNDEPGRKAAQECAELLTPGKAYIATLPLKDANEMLVAGRVGELISAMWNAPPYRPDGIVAGADTWDLIRTEDLSSSFPYPWHAINAKTHGMRLGEIVTWTAGSGIGKSTACREIAAHIARSGERVGFIALEENVRRTALGFLSIELNRPLHLGLDGMDEAELRAAFDRTLGKDSVFLYDHFGSLESKNLFSKIRQMVRGCGVKWVVLDHVSIVVSGMESDNERKDLDVLMTKLRSLAEELRIGVHLVSHLRRKDGRAHEDGGRVSLSDLRGSQAIAQLSDMVIALERNQQSKRVSNIGRVRILKNRFSGETGLAGGLQYSTKTGRLSEVTLEDDDEAGDGHPGDADRGEF